MGWRHRTRSEPITAPERRHSSGLRRVTLLLSSLALTAALLEGGARLVLALMGPEAAPIQVGREPSAVIGGAAGTRARAAPGGDRPRPGRSFRNALRAELDLIYRPHPDLFFRLKPNLEIEATGNPRIFDLQTNSLGLRGDEVQQPKPPDRYRILAVGDSCTFGSGAGQSDTYPAQLQRKLAALRPDLSVEVINAGVPGFTFYQMTRYLEIEGYGLEPDAVVLATGFNDASPATAGPKLRSGRSHLLTDREYAETLHARSSLGITRLLWRAGLLPLRTARGSDSELKRRVPLAEYDVGLRRFARQSRQRGAVPVIVSWPLRAQATPGAAKTEVEQVVARYQQTAADSARAAGAPFVDLLPQVRGKPGLFVDTVHMGAAGYGLVAEAVATGLLPHLGPARLAGRDDSP